MSNINAGIVLKTRFIQAGANVFQEYINYIDREEAIRNDKFGSYSVYTDYMDNPEKTSALFTADVDKLYAVQKRELKKVHEIAQNNGSLMWQNVISFDNRWLEKNGLYNSRTNQLDEIKMREVTRNAMAQMSDRENMKSSLLWSAAIHYNTDNVHIHIAAVEPVPTRDRGVLKQSTLDTMKSKVYSTIIDRSVEYMEITNIIRKNIVDKDFVSPHKDKKIKDLFLKVYDKLPDNKNLWQYNNRAVSYIRPELDKLSELYIKTYHKEDFKRLQEKLEIEEILQKEAFGKRYHEEMHTNFAENKLKDLYTRMGNSILSEMKKYSESSTFLNGIPSRNKQNNQRTGRQNIEYTNRNAKEYIRGKLRHGLRIHNPIYLLKKALKKDYQSFKNQLEFERLSREIGKDETL